VTKPIGSVRLVSVIYQYDDVNQRLKEQVVGDKRGGALVRSRLRGSQVP
jgi:hypothetical protein